MTRNNADFFHGTNARFAPGDIVSPSYDESGEGEAHATDLLDAAKTFGSNVFQVEPLDPDELEEHYLEHKGTPGTHYTSAKGFRVVKRVK